MTIEQRALDLALDNFTYNAGAYYGGATGLSLGAGLIYDKVRYPIFDRESGKVYLVDGLVYVLTHECDVDQNNNRLFNNSVLFCPIIKFDEWSRQYAATFSPDSLMGLIPDLAKDIVYRATFLPPIPTKIGNNLLPFGGLLAFNEITNTHVSNFAEKKALAVCAISSYALQFIDAKLKSHLFREKAQTLPRLK